MADSALEAATRASPPSSGEPIKPHPYANAGIGMLGAGLGTAAAAGLAPIVVLPAIVVGAFAGYFLTNKIPAK